MILGKKDNDRVRNMEATLTRLHHAFRWLSEFDHALGPMWDYIMGKEETSTTTRGHRLTHLVEPRIDEARQKLRKAIRSAGDMPPPGSEAS